MCDACPQARIYSAVANAPNSMISPDQIDLMRSTHSPPHSADNDESVAQGMRFGTPYVWLLSKQALTVFLARRGFS